METNLRRIGVVEDDPEYDADAAADVDVDDPGVELTDPADVPPDLGDSGQPGPKVEEEAPA